MEWNAALEIKKEIVAAERHLAECRARATNITPVLDGMPRTPQFQSKVERNVLKILECEKELENLRGELEAAKKLLTEKISAIENPERQRLMQLRCVECLPFKEIAHRMRMPLRQAYRLYEKVLLSK